MAGWDSGKLRVRVRAFATLVEEQRGSPGQSPGPDHRGAAAKAPGRIHTRAGGGRSCDRGVPQSRNLGRDVAVKTVVHRGCKRGNRRPML